MYQIPILHISDKKNKFLLVTVNERGDITINKLLVLSNYNTHVTNKFLHTMTQLLCWSETNHINLQLSKLHITIEEGQSDFSSKDIDIKNKEIKHFDFEQLEHEAINQFFQKNDWQILNINNIVYYQSFFTSNDKKIEDPKGIFSDVLKHNIMIIRVNGYSMYGLRHAILKVLQAKLGHLLPSSFLAGLMFLQHDCHLYNLTIEINTHNTVLSIIRKDSYIKLEVLKTGMMSFIQTVSQKIRSDIYVAEKIVKEFCENHRLYNNTLDRFNLDNNQNYTDKEILDLLSLEGRNLLKQILKICINSGFQTEEIKQILFVGIGDQLPFLLPNTILLFKIDSKSILTMDDIKDQIKLHFSDEVTIDPSKFYRDFYPLIAMTLFHQKKINEDNMPNNDFDKFQRIKLINLFIIIGTILFITMALL